MARVGRDDARVVVADDDALTRTVLRMALEERGFRVVECSSGAELLAELSRTVADLVIVDGHMPGLSLAETVDGIHAMASPQPAILALSGDPGLEGYLLERGIAFLGKPTRIDALYSAVELALSPATQAID